MRLSNNHYEDANVISDLTHELKHIVDSNTIVVCIGTDRCIWDSVGPLVGTILKENDFQLPVYGTIEEPIHAVNIEKKLKEINVKHPHANIIGIDACLGGKIGYISLSDKPIHPGRGVNKILPDVGNYSIIGILNQVIMIHHYGQGIT